MNDLADNALIELISSKSSEAFEVLYRRYQDMLLQYCAKRLYGNVELAADTVDEVFFDVWANASSYQDKSSLIAWLYVVARNKSIDALRKIKEVSVDMDSVPEVVDEAQDFERDVEQDDESQMLHACIFKLSEKHQEVLLLYYMKEKKLNDIAHIVGIDVGTVKSRLHHAKKLLKEQLQFVVERPT